MTELQTIVRYELVRRFRSRSVLMNVVVAPVLLALVFGLLLGSSDSGSGSVRFSLAVADEVGTETSGIVAASLLAIDDDAVAIESSPSRQDAVDAVDRGAVGAAIVIVGDASDSGIVLEVIGDVESPLSAQVAQSVANTTAARIERQGGDPVVLQTAPLGGRPLSLVAYYGAAMAGLTLMYAVGIAARSLLDDRSTSRLSRMVAAGTSVPTVLGGKVMAVFITSTLGFCVVWLTTSLVSGAVWGSPAGVVALIGATVASLCGIALLVGSVATTPQQVDTATAVVGFVLALMGGAFVPPGDAPEAMRVLARLSPNGISLRGFTELNADVAGLADVSGEIVQLVVIGVVCGLVGALRLSRVQP